MKKTLLSLLFLLGVASIYAQEYNYLQRQLVSDISSHLSTLGYTPEKQRDGLKFKNEGTTYYIEVSQEDTSPMYLRLCRYVKYSESLAQEKVLRDLNSYNKKLGVKVCGTETGVVISAEMYLTSSSMFTDVLPTLLSQIKVTYKQIIE